MTQPRLLQWGCLLLLLGIVMFLLVGSAAMLWSLGRASWALFGIVALFVLAARWHKTDSARRQLARQDDQQREDLAAQTAARQDHLGGEDGGPFLPDDGRQVIHFDDPDDMPPWERPTPSRTLEAVAAWAAGHRAALLALTGVVLLVPWWNAVTDPRSAWHWKPDPPKAAAPATKVRPRPLPPIVFRRDYDAISMDTRYSTVAMQHGPGVEQYSYQHGQEETRVIAWRNPDGSYMLLTFQDNWLVSKQQSGLP